MTGQAAAARNDQGAEGAAAQAPEAYLGIDIGSISTKGVVIGADGAILARSYLWTEGNPVQATKNVIDELHGQLAEGPVRIVGAGTTGSARRLVGAMLGATVVKNEITAHAVGTTFLHPDVRTILEIGGQDSKIICVADGIAVDYAMNTLCAAGTGSFLSSQAHRLGAEVEEFGEIALTSKHPANIAARCTVFAESDLVHKIQVGYAREDIIAGLCNAVASNYLNNVGKGKRIEAPVVFQGGVSKNVGVVHAFEEQLGMPVAVDPDGHRPVRQRQLRFRGGAGVHVHHARGGVPEVREPLRDHLRLPRPRPHRQLGEPLREGRGAAVASRPPSRSRRSFLAQPKLGKGPKHAA